MIAHCEGQEHEQERKEGHGAGHGLVLSFGLGEGLLNVVVMVILPWLCA